MQVVVAGGHGKIALRLTRLLSMHGDLVRSLIRNPEHASDVRKAGGEPVLCDLEAASTEEVATSIGRANAVVFAAGAGPGSGARRKETVDYGAAVKLIGAAKANRIPRYVMISTVRADANATGDEVFDAYLRAKGRADEELQASGLDYTVVRPSGLSDAPGSGRVEVAASSDETTSREAISRDDVAAVIEAVLRDRTTAGRTFEVTGGDTPVEQALAALR